METKTKNRELCKCNCDIRYSVTDALNDAKPHLHNLTLRITRKFFRSKYKTIPEK